MFDHIDNSVNDDLDAATGTIVDTDFEGDVNTLHLSYMQCFFHVLHIFVFTMLHFIC